MTFESAGTLHQLLSDVRVAVVQREFGTKTGQPVKLWILAQVVRGSPDNALGLTVRSLLPFCCD